MLRAWILLGVWAVLMVPVALVFIPWTLLTGNAGPLYRWGSRIGGLGLRASGVRTRLHFEAPLPATACLFLVNHASNLDPPLLSAALLPRRMAMLVKKELLRVPLLGPAMRLTGFVPVARTGSVEDARRTLEQTAAMLRSGVSMAAFVEGTRSPDGRLLPFKRGPFFLAMELGVPVVPVTLEGTHRLWPKGATRLRAGTVRVTIHAPLRAADFSSRDALKDAVREQIASSLPAERLTA